MDQEIVSFEDLEEIDDLPEVDDELYEAIDSYIMFYDEFNAVYVVVFFDEDEQPIANYEFVDLEMAEVFLEEEFDVEIAELGDYDQELVDYFANINENFASRVMPKFEKLADTIVGKFNKSMTALGVERRETKEMVSTFFDYLASKVGRGKPPTPDQIKQAVDQMKDINRFALILSIMILPFGSEINFVLNKVAERYGIRYLPSAFYEARQSYYKCAILVESGRMKRNIMESELDGLDHFLTNLSVETLYS